MFEFWLWLCMVSWLKVLLVFSWFRFPYLSAGIECLGGGGGGLSLSLFASLSVFVVDGVSLCGMQAPSSPGRTKSL